MSRSYRQFDEARAVRLETLDLVEGLDQAQSEFRPGRDRLDTDTWSVGMVLDHLLKLDALIVRELEVAINQRRRGLPFIYRGLADIDTTVPWVFAPILPFVEVPFSLFNTFVPQGLRRALTGNRSIPLQAPGVIRPRFGKPVARLRDDLRSTFDVLAEQLDDEPDLDLNRVYYYNPITGLDSVAGLYRFISNHEQRHQKQLRDILGDPAFPR